MRIIILSFFLLPLYLYAACPSPTLSESAILKELDTLRDASKHKNLSECLDILLKNKIHAENMSFIEYKIYALLWQKKFHDAKTMIDKRIKSEELKFGLYSDLYWYQGDSKAQIELLERQSTLSPLHIERLAKAKGNLNEFNKNRFQSRFSLLQYAESQNRSYRELNGGIQLKRRDFKYRLEASYGTRDFGATTLSDLTVGPGISYHYHDYDFGIDYYHTIGREFLYEYAIVPKIYRKLPYSLVAGIEYHFKHYPIGFRNHGYLIVDWYKGLFMLGQKIGLDLKSYQIKPTFTYTNLFDLSLPFGIGKGESSRPYLVEEKEQSYFTYGASLYLHRGAESGPLFMLERHVEKEFNHTMFGVSYIAAY